MSKLQISATESATELGLAFPAQPRCGYCSTNCSHECFLFNSREKHSGKLFCFLFRWRSSTRPSDGDDDGFGGDFSPSLTAR